MFSLRVCARIACVASVSAVNRCRGSLGRSVPARRRLPTLLSLAAVGTCFAEQNRRGNEDDYMAEPITEDLHTHDGLKAEMERLCMRIQGEFCHALEAEETSGQKFKIDRWRRKNENEGGGITCVLEDGAVFERAGVNITVMRAPLSKKLEQHMRARGKNLPEDRSFNFFAAGISSVIHPVNPHVPTMHFNFRYFYVTDDRGENAFGWFGGGADLTPYYLEEDDVRLFHSTFKTACDKHSPAKYPEYKKICDKYFYNPKRGESRGVGGIFFDDLESEDPRKDFDFVRDCADAIIPSYLPIVSERKNAPYGAAERDWQLLRRGRYVEFNLVYDRGTRFGFETPGARIESILVSLPRTCKWQYRHEPVTGSREETLTRVLETPRDWV